MPRIRTIKPEFWADEKLGPMEAITRLVFLALISLADDAGRLLDSVKQLDGEIFAYTSESCRRSLDELSASGRIRRGETASGQKVIQLVNWRHQKIDKPNLLGALPPIDDQSTINRRTLADQSAPLSVSVPLSVPTINDQRSTTVDKDFEELWAHYPARTGGNSRSAALTKYRALRRSVSAGVLFDGVRRYANFCAASGKTGTEYVKQTVTFLGPARHWEDPWIVPPERARANGKITEGRNNLTAWMEQP